MKKSIHIILTALVLPLSIFIIDEVFNLSAGRHIYMICRYMSAMVWIARDKVALMLAHLRGA